MSLVRGEKGMQETKVKAKIPKSKSSGGTIRSLRKKKVLPLIMLIFFVTSKYCLTQPGLPRWHWW